MRIYRLNSFWFVLILLLPARGMNAFVYAQELGDPSTFTDSITSLIQRTPSDTAQASLYNKLADYWADRNDSLAIDYALKSLALSQTDSFYIGSAYFYLGGAYYTSQQEKAKAAYLKAVEHLQSNRSPTALSLQSRAWHNYGTLLQRAGDDKAYIDILLTQCIPLAREAADSVRIADNLADVGMVFENITAYEKAILYYREAIELAEKINPQPVNLSSYYANLAKIYLYNEQDDLAESALEKGQKSLANAPLSYRNVEYELALGIYYTRKKQWELALRTFDKGIRQTNHLNLPFLNLALLYQKYKTLRGAGRREEAKTILLALNQDSLVNLHAEDKKTVLYNLAEINRETGNSKEAYDWLSQYAQVADSLNKIALNAKIAEMEIRYQGEKKQREILDLKNQNNEQQLILQKRHFQIYGLIGGIILLFLLSSIVYVFYLSKKQKVLQQKRNHALQLQQLQKDQQLQVYSAMLKGQEQERRRIAQDLHDEVGGILAGLKLKLSDLFQSDANNSIPSAPRIIEQLDHSIQSVRRISRNMMPETLIRFGLASALKELCESLTSPSLSIDFQSFALKDNLPHSTQLAVYRIIQELLTNAIRHGKASFILVQCSQNENRIFITVEDNGKGFIPNSRVEKKGIGMKNIQNRVDYMDGKIAIQSKVDEGTVVNVELTVNEIQ